MKYIRSLLTLLMIAWSVHLPAHTSQTEEAQLDSIVNELRELGAQQDPSEIDYIPPLTEEDYNDLLEYSKSLNDLINSEEGAYIELDNEESKKLSFSEFIETNPTIADGTFLVKYLGWTFLIVGAILGWLLIKGKRLFLGKMILGSLLPLCLIFLAASTTDLSYYPYAWALAMMIIYSFLFSSVVCIYLYGYGSIVFVYKRSENKYRIAWLLLSILLCSIFPPLFLIPIVYFISKGYLRTEECKDTNLYKLMPYLWGILLGLMISIPFCAITGYLGRTIREMIYYLQDLW